jgi:hypothetical protein
MSFLQKKGDLKSPSTVIRNCLKVLESAIRFKLVRFFSAYIEILKLVALEKGQDQFSENIEPYHIYLEFGSSNRHALNLMALGLSRFTALHLEGFFELPNDVEAELYIEELVAMDIESMNMPKLCKKEISDLLYG